VPGPVFASYIEAISTLAWAVTSILRVCYCYHSVTLLPEGFLAFFPMSLAVVGLFSNHGCFVMVVNLPRGLDCGASICRNST